MEFENCNLNVAKGAYRIKDFRREKVPPSKTPLHDSLQANLFMHIRFQTSAGGILIPELHASAKIRTRKLSLFLRISDLRMVEHG